MRVGGMFFSLPESETGAGGHRLLCLHVTAEEAEIKRAMLTDGIPFLGFAAVWSGGAQIALVLDGSPIRMISVRSSDARTIGRLRAAGRSLSAVRDRPA